MSVQVLFFASLRDTVGVDALEVELSGPTTIDGLLTLLAVRLNSVAHTALTDALNASRMRIAVNQDLLPDQNPGIVAIQPGDEVAFLPPVTGG
jgi:molybdopterin synthase sulfur carrier subunit